MKRLIDQHGEFPERSISKNIFADVVETIVNQQLSGKAGDTIFKRFKALFRTRSFPTPKTILAMPDKKIRAAGLSFSKIGYIKGFSKAVLEKQLNIKKLYELPDEEVIVELVKLKGIGQWTAEMILMFSLARPDVFSGGDLGLCTAVATLYNVDRDDKKRITNIAVRWSPYRSVACRYLWKSLD